MILEPLNGTAHKKRATPAEELRMTKLFSLLDNKNHFLQISIIFIALTVLSGMSHSRFELLKHIYPCLHPFGEKSSFAGRIGFGPSFYLDRGNA